MEQHHIQSLTATFEGHAQQTEDGVEYWLARDLQQLLGYGKWDNFQSVISKAKTACEVSNHGVSDHFADVGKMIELGKGGQREIDDIMLTPCLNAENGDSCKQEIAFAQTLSTWDKVTTIEQLLAAKKALIQQLLTGKRRVKLEAAWHV